MKNITNQYKDLKEGKMSQANFMRNLRMTFPHLVTNVTSFNDSIKILKNKGLIVESDIYGSQIAGNPEQERISRDAKLPSALMQGYKAFQNGVSIDENPYDKASEESQEWISGWSYGKKLSQMYKDTDPNLGEPVFENIGEETPEEIEQAIELLKMQRQDKLNTDPRSKDPEIVSDEIDDINIEIQRLENLLASKDLSKGLDEKKEKFNPKQLRMGTKIEKEHTKSTKKARKIATDHLKEKPDYYTKLKKAGLEEKKVTADISEAKEIKGSSGKEQYANFNEVDNLNAQEVLIGIDCEMQIDPKLSKIEATKIVIKTLKKNPYYYSNYALAGKEAEAEPMYKYKEGSDQMKPVKGENTFVDKDNAMKPPKGVEKVKASAAKANKETNKGVKGVEYMKLTAKTVRGVKRMDATGEKMKKIKVKESLKSLIRQIIAENLQKPTEQDYKVAKDILDSYYGVNENVIENTKQAIQKYKNYANKGLMTAGVIALLNSACAPELTSGNYNAANMSRRDKQCAGSWYQSSPKKSAYMAKNYPGNKKGGNWWDQKKKKR